MFAFNFCFKIFICGVRCCITLGLIICVFSIFSLQCVDKIKEVFKIVKNLSNIIFLSRFFPMLIIINSLIMRVDDKAHCNYGIINAKLDCIAVCCCIMQRSIFALFQLSFSYYKCNSCNISNLPRVQWYLIGRFPGIFFRVVLYKDLG